MPNKINQFGILSYFILKLTISKKIRLNKFETVLSIFLWGEKSKWTLGCGA